MYIFRGRCAVCTEYAMRYSYTHAIKHGDNDTHYDIEEIRRMYVEDGIL